MTNVIQMVQPAIDRFEEWWRLYPRKLGKPLAKAKWQAIVGDGLITKTLCRDSGTYVQVELKGSPEELIEGVKRYRDSVWDQKAYKFSEFICHPATWLNQGRWLDGV